jgi:periplasmic protein CpxP/Spy
LRRYRLARHSIHGLDEQLALASSLQEFIMNRIRSSSFRVARSTVSRLALAGLLALPAAAVMAQATAPSAPMPQAGQAAPMDRDARMHGARHGQRDGADMQARMEKRQSDLKARLQLTPAQEPAWSAFTSAMKPPARPGEGSRDQRADMARLSTPERIDKMRAERTQRMAEMNKLMDQRGEATKTFYSALTTEQKKTFDSEAFRFGPGHEGGRPHHG